MNDAPRRNEAAEGITDPKTWALLGSREFLDHQSRVRSIIFQLTEMMEGTITEADAKNGSQMEAAYIGEVLENIDWLLEVMEDKARVLKQDLQAAGVTA